MEIDWDGLACFFLCGLCPALLVFAIVVDEVGRAAARWRGARISSPGLAQVALQAATDAIDDSIVATEEEE